VLIRDAEVRGDSVDLRIHAGRVLEIAAALDGRPNEKVIDARGGALLPGLHDHHIHLFSLAAALESIPCGPPDTTDAEALADAIAHASAAQTDSQTWLRGAGYFESVAGALDRDVLDRICSDRPIRIQHRSGAMWFLNSRALEELKLTGPRNASHWPSPGVETDSEGRATGRLFRLDDWMRERLPARPTLDLGIVGRRLAHYGVTGLTDATPTNGAAEIDLLMEAQASGALPQRVRVMGRAELKAESPTDALSIGAFKILLDEPALPDLDRLIESIRGAHQSGRAVAIHTVTRSEIHFALAALEAAGTAPGDRLEHASVAPPETLSAVRKMNLAIVTQPNFAAERGDDYLSHVDRIDRPFLYRLRTWIEADVRLAAGTDAPFGHPDPWRAMRAAVERRTASGALLGPKEALTPEEALALFSTPLEDPGGPAREIRTGEPADLCLLDVPWSRARIDLESCHVRAAFCSGELVFEATARR
jgi:predicted amidohydrolase YtcJ